MTHDKDRWKRAAEALDLGIPPERVEAVAGLLEDFMPRAKRALDRDLSLVEPVGVFRPARPEERR
jgi:hypothetical protein